MKEIVFTGGEVFARNDALSIIRMAREMFFDVIIFSNISLLNKEKVNELASLYINAISCTIFSLNPEIHDSIVRKKGALQIVLENLKLLKDNNINIIIKTPLLKINKDETKKIEEFCKYNEYLYKVDAQIIPVRNSIDNQYNSELCLSFKELIDIQEDIDRINGAVPKTRRGCGYSICSSQKISLYIAADGSIYPCSLFPLSLGNAYSQSIKNIKDLNKKKALENIEVRNMDKCGTCALSDYCVICPGLSYMESSNYLNCSSLSRKTAIARKEIYG
ncbi:MAG TPA: radical SAM protein [Candidatus Tetragenococcus pullicola]|nr:radical SAM protein [Candidatus Tetragenococcus pullicola]